MLQRANCQGQCTLYTREQSGEMEQKGKDMGEKSNLVCMVMVFVAMKSELTRVSFVCPLKGFSCDTQQSSVVWHILNMHLWCGTRMSCSLQTSVELARSQHGLCWSHYVVREGPWMSSESRREKKTAEWSAVYSKKGIRRCLLASLPQIIFRCLLNPLMLYNCEAKAMGANCLSFWLLRGLGFLLVQSLLHWLGKGQVQVFIDDLFFSHRVELV